MRNQLPRRMVAKLERTRELPPRTTLLNSAIRRLEAGLTAMMNRQRIRLGPQLPTMAQLGKAISPYIGEDVHTILDHFRQRTRPAFFFSPAEAVERAVLLQTHSPISAQGLISVADAVCAHTFDLLGSGPVALGEVIDWHADFKNGYRWPMRYYADIEKFDPEQPYDVKVPWELSRCQHFVTLGQAYQLTGDEKYALEFVTQFSHWIDANPPMVGVNWACTMDVAIRAVNLIWAYYLFFSSQEFTDDVLLQFLKSVLTHGRHIINNLEDGPYQNNHYLSNGVGLVYLGLIFPEFKEAHAWLNKGTQIVFGEIERQVYPDGVGFEASIPYHRLTVELFFSPILLCLRNKVVVPSSVVSRLEKMFEFIMAYTKPDGTVPILGDADDGRLHRLNRPGLPREFLDHRYLLAIGAVLFDRNDFARAAEVCWEEASWLFGKRADEARQRLLSNPISLPHKVSCSLPDAGIYVMRRENLHLLIDAGSNGQGGRGGHAHNDTLSFELYAYDKTFIQDPGLYIYSDPEARNLFRSTVYHNTVVVDGQEMNHINPQLLWDLGNDATPRVRRWESTDTYDFFDGEHSGYERLPHPVIHRRQVYFSKTGRWWLLRDLLAGEGKHRFDLYFHLAALPVEPVQGMLLAVRTACQGANLVIVLVEATSAGEPIEPTMEIIQGWVSPSYGVRHPAPVVRYTYMAQTPVEFLTLLHPFVDQMPRNDHVGTLIANVLFDENLGYLMNLKPKRGSDVHEKTALR